MQAWILFLGLSQLADVKNGQRRLDTLNLVSSTAVVPPKQLRPEVPTDLETICVK
jgi:hypothetical protein